jgi:hypothetical protein
MAGFAGMTREPLVRILLDYLVRTGQNTVVNILMAGLAGFGAGVLGAEYLSGFFGSRHLCALCEWDENQERRNRP